MDKITFINKVDTKVTTVAEINKVTGANLNEIKNVANLAVNQLELNTPQIASNKEDITSLINGNGKTYISVSNAMAASPLPSDNTPFTVRDSVSNLEDGFYIYLSTEAGGYKFLEALEALANGYYVVNSLLDFDSLISSASPGVWMVISDITLDANKTIPAGVTLQFRNAKINLGGFTLTGVYTFINSGLNQIFDVNGTLGGTFKNEEIFPEWFGAIGDGIADDFPAIDKCLDSSIPVLKCIGTTYLLSDRLLIKKFGQIIEGSSQYSTTFKINDSVNKEVLSTNSFSGIQLHNFRIDGNGANNTSGGGLVITNSYYCSFVNVDVRFSKSTAIDIINSNNNHYSICQTHNTFGDGFKLDATSMHNTFTSCGVEDFGDYGVNCLGIGNTFTQIWIEQRTVGVVGTEIAIRINGRDNLIDGGEFKGGNVDNKISRCIELGGSSDNTIVRNAHCAHSDFDIYLIGANKYRTIYLGEQNSIVTNSDSDTTTLIQSGNNIYSNLVINSKLGINKTPITEIDVISTAPIQTFEASNGVSGLRTNIIGTTGNGYRIQLNGIDAYELKSDKLIPKTDNDKSLGDASNRFSTVYAGTGTINTSDERLKTELLDINEKEKKCALELKLALKKFKFIESVEKKGEDARIHFGIGAQTVRNIFESCGLHASNYALFCFDEWEEKEEITQEVKDNSGIENTIVIQEYQSSGNRFGIRYDELIVFIISSI
tara:strand:+ start:333 stop:2480 length:2148 start_codon:yes stop_codon:yes gene_type:complete